MTISMEEYDGSQPLPETPTVVTEERPIVDYNDLLYNEYRIALLQRWDNIERFHVAFGCPLDSEESITAAACIVHGTPAERRLMTRDEFLGTFNPELLSS